MKMDEEEDDHCEQPQTRSRQSRSHPFHLHYLHQQKSGKPLLKNEEEEEEQKEEEEKQDAQKKPREE